MGSEITFLAFLYILSVFSLRKILRSHGIVNSTDSTHAWLIMAGLTRPHQEHRADCSICDNLSLSQPHGTFEMCKNILLFLMRRFNVAENRKCTLLCLSHIFCQHTDSITEKARYFSFLTVSIRQETRCIHVW